MRRYLVFALMLVPAFAWAETPRAVKKQLTVAADALDDALAKIKRQHPCKETVGRQLDQAGDRVDAMQREARPEELFALKTELTATAQTASLSGCPMATVESIERAIEALEEARAGLWERHGGSDDRHNHHHDDGDDRRPPAAPFAQLLPLVTTPNSVFDGESSVRITVPELRLSDMRGQTFYFGARFRSYEGQWTPWVTSQTWTIPTDDFVWKGAFNHFLRYSALAEDDFSDGRFVAQVSVFDGNGRELASRDTVFKVRLPHLPIAPVLPPPVVVRDCGTGMDPGCVMLRDGQPPMDALTFSGFLTSLRSNGNEMLRVDIARTVLRRNYLTAVQLGATMDLFMNEMLRLDVGKTAAPHVVDPQHALGLASKFSNNLLAREFVEAMSRQGATHPIEPVQPPPPLQAPPLPPPPVPGVPPPPRPMGTPPPPVAPPPPMGVVRDCGTGQDPGCAMARNGQYPMDGATFQGVVASLRAQANELVRADTCSAVFANNYLTAVQLGFILDLFSNELTRLDVAKRAASRVVNPQHAIGFASKWHNSLLGQEYTTVMLNSR